MVVNRPRFPGRILRGTRQVTFDFVWRIVQNADPHSFARQLDTVPATIEALPDLMEAADDKLEVLIDGGIRRGTDVFKALALGAKAVGVGRPLIWGLAVDGEQGAKRVLDILRKDFELTMRLCHNRGYQ